MSDDELEGLADGEWFSDGADDNYWTCGTGHVDMSERREAGERQHVQIKVKVEPGALYGTVNDISLGGVLVYTNPPLPQGSYAELTLQTDRGTAKVGGIVRWRLRGSPDNSPDGRMGMGIEFIWMSLQMRTLMGMANNGGPARPL
jgi:hypothetical protein